MSVRALSISRRVVGELCGGRISNAPCQNPMSPAGCRGLGEGVELLDRVVGRHCPDAAVDVPAVHHGDAGAGIADGESRDRRPRRSLRRHRPRRGRQATSRPRSRSSGAHRRGARASGAAVALRASSAPRRGPRDSPSAPTQTSLPRGRAFRPPSRATRSSPSRPWHESTSRRCGRARCAPI